MCDRGKPMTFGPVAIGNLTDTDLISPHGAGSGGNGYAATAHFIILRYIRVTNPNGSVFQVSLYKGASGAGAAGTEIFSNTNIPAHDSIEWRGFMRLEGTNGYLGGHTNTAFGITLSAEGEVGVV